MQHTLQLTAGNHIEPTTQFCQHSQHSEVGVRLHRVTNCVRDLAKSSLKSGDALADGGCGIDVKWCAESIRQLTEGNALAVELAFAINEAWWPRMLRSPIGGHLRFPGAPLTRITTTV